MSKPRKVFTLGIACDNAAFDDPSPCLEVARILGEVSRQVDNGSIRGSIRDSNGNVVGYYALEDSK